jgi:D,D-heptose 1,7-bisphosphate phosphatase
MSNVAKVAILAGGDGTRLSSVSKGLPKAMVPIAGVPMLEHQLELCKSHDFTDIALLVRQGHQVIRDYFGDGEAFGVRLTYVEDSFPVGTGGALRDAADKLDENFLVLYGDTFLDVDLGAFYHSYHSSNVDACLFVHPNDHPFDSDLVEVSDTGLVEKIHGYPHAENLLIPNLVNAALCVLNKQAFLDAVIAEEKCDLAKDVFPRILANQKRVVAYKSPEYIKDAGTPERLQKVEKHIAMGMPAMLSKRSMRRAIFLDRDGTLNLDPGHIKSPDQMHLLPSVEQAVNAINASGYLTILATNQPVVARGDVTIDGLKKIHSELERQLALGGAYLDEIYFCPHHPDPGFAGEEPSLKIVCDCRKPAVGLFKRAARELDIDLGSSWMIGDSTSDVEAGKRAGMNTVLLRTGVAGTDMKHNVKPDFVFPALADAVDWILTGYAEMQESMCPLIDGLARKRLLVVGGPAGSGKSVCSQVVKFLTAQAGRPAHVICLDGWLHPYAERDQAPDLLGRYNMAMAAQELTPLLGARDDITVAEFIYERIGRSFLPKPLKHNIGPDDLVILEGCPALFMETLCESESASTLYIDAELTTLKDRFWALNESRGRSDKQICELFENRYMPELALIERCKGHSDFIFNERGVHDCQ